MKKITQGNKKIGMAILSGVLTSVTVLVAGLLLNSYLINSEIISEKTVLYGVVLTMLICAGCGAFAASWRAGEKKLIICLVTGAMFYILLLLVNILFFGSGIEGAGATFLAVAAAVSTVAILSIAPKKKGANRKIKF